MQGAESTAPSTERRTNQRIRASGLIFVELADGNGGIVTSLSERGLALTAAGVLGEEGDQLPKMQIQLPEFPEAIEASGQIAWKSKSGKEAGVRFVDLGEEARDRIQKWISEETRKNSLQVEDPELPEMQSPPALGPEKLGSELSFSDVASSRVAAEAPADDFLAAARQAEAVSPPPTETGTFVDVSKAVASAFERAAFPEERKTEFRDCKETRTPPPPEEACQGRPPRSFPERRSHSRRPVLLFTYAKLGVDNGGLVFNLGEGGLALTAAAALQDSHFTLMRVRFPDSQDWFETKGRRAWISDSGKEAGIEFVGVAEDVRARIREWISLGEPADDFQPEEGERQENQEQPSELPGSAESASPVSIPLESTASFEERLTTPVAARPAGMKEGLAKAALRRRLPKIKEPEPAWAPRDAVQPRSGVGRKALVAAGVVLLALGWTFLQRNNLNDASGVVGQKVPNNAIPSGSKERTLVGAAESTADPRAEHIPDVTPQAQTMDAGTSKTTSVPSVKQDAPNQTAANLTHNPAADLTLRAPDRRERKTLPPREPRLDPRRGLAAPIRTQRHGFWEAKSLEAKPVETAKVRSTPLKELNGAPPSFTATPIQPQGALTFGKENEALLAAPKQPEVPAGRKPIVTVSLDPYPSIRMPEKENSKKSHQGKSLLMGHLVVRVDPVYPEQAKQEGVEGAVKIHVVLGREGAVESLTPMSGPPLLAPAAINAVRQWRFSPTLLGGQAIETEEDVTVLFRLSNMPSKD